MTRKLLAVGVLACLFWTLIGAGQADEQGTESKVPHGHSAYGMVFNEGPRQSAYLMGGTGKVHFPITTTDPKAQQFFDQGIGQLHGFWYFEAERSFRQAATIDPHCAIAYWGMAMANFNNGTRAKGFIAKAVEKREQASARERLYIDALAAYQKDKKRPEYVRALEKIYTENPDDIEARAFLVCARFWHFKDVGGDTEKLDKLLDVVFKANPMHPAHHYCIHLWDGKNNTRALPSAAVCGLTTPAIAHQWHMSGHIYSGLKRYADAAWDQEASARVDHFHMMHDRVLPDQIHNYAHNQEWLIRNLSHIGRMNDAVALAKNLIELPRHPRFNTLQRSGSTAGYGRTRLLDVLKRYELWDDALALADTMYLEPTDIPEEQIKRLHLLGIAHGEKGDTAKLRQQIVELEARLVKERKNPTPPEKNNPKALDEPAAQAVGGNLGTPELLPPPRVEPAEPQSKGPTAKGGQPKAPPLGRGAAIEEALNELRGYEALASGDTASALASFKKAKTMDRARLARVHLLAGEKNRAEEIIRQMVDAAKNQVVPLANQVDILERCGKTEEAAAAFQKLRDISGHIDSLDSPVFKRLAPVVERLELKADWRGPATLSKDRGERPAVDSLGPLRWQPSPAPPWSLSGSEKELALGNYKGRPVIVIFYLGHGCLHCVEQLNSFAPRTEEFRAAGIPVVAISSDTLADLKKSQEKYKQGTAFPFPIAADPNLDVFRAYRCFDDFEGKPLHGTFLIDGNGLVRWQDIGYEPFDKPEFLLKEAKRLLELPAK